jgi:hypothetical protein
LNSSHSIDIVPSDADGPVCLERAACAPASTSSNDPGSSSEAGKNGAFSLEGSLKGMVLLNLSAMLFGSNQVIIKTTEELLSPIALDALRFGAAALCFAPLLPRALKQPQLIRPAVDLGVWLTGALTIVLPRGVSARQYLRWTAQHAGLAKLSQCIPRTESARGACPSRFAATSGCKVHVLRCSDSLLNVAQSAPVERM